MKKESLLPPYRRNFVFMRRLLFGCAESSDAKTNSDDDLDLEQESLEAEETPLCPAEIAARPFTINKEEVFYIGPYLYVHGRNFYDNNVGNGNGVRLKG
jgi:hypothetical protein